jgi:hypothetical protein
MVKFIALLVSIGCLFLSVGADSNAAVKLYFDEEVGPGLIHRVLANAR